MRKGCIKGCVKGAGMVRQGTSSVLWEPLFRPPEVFGNPFWALDTRRGALVLGSWEDCCSEACSIQGNADFRAAPKRVKFHAESGLLGLLGHLLELPWVLLGYSWAFSGRS